MVKIMDLIEDTPPSIVMPAVKRQKRVPAEGFRKYHQIFEKDPFNEYQNFLYSRALFGLGIYSGKELEFMHKDKKKRIATVHKRAATILNEWKWSIVTELSNHMFQKVFPKSPITKEFLDTVHTKEELALRNTLSFKLLNITKPQIVERFISEGVLPSDFYELKPSLPLKYKNGKFRTKISR